MKEEIKEKIKQSKSKEIQISFVHTIMEQSIDLDHSEEEYSNVVCVSSCEGYEYVILELLGKDSTSTAQLTESEVKATINMLQDALGDMKNKIDL